MSNDYYALPDYVEDWIDVAFRRIPKGWDIVVIPEQGAVQVVDNLKRVQQTYGYHAISEGFDWPRDWE